MQSKASRVFVALMLLWALQPGAVAQQAEAASTGGDSVLNGKIFTADGQTPLAGAVVLAYHLSTERVYSSGPTSSSGEYRIEGLPYGYFDLAVKTTEDLYVGNQVINLAPAGKAAVLFTVTEFETPPAPGDPRGRDFPGANQPSTGIAAIHEKARGREFWRSPKGVAILGGAGALALLALAGGSGDDDAPAAPSPSAP